VLTLLQEATSQLPAWLEVTRAALGSLQSLIAAAGIIIGGIFAYYRFFKEETHTSRLQPKVSGSAEIHGGTIYLRTTVRAENTGQVLVELDLELTALEIFTRKPGDTEWEYRHIESIFREHDQVQPGEEIEDQVWIEIPHNNEIGLKMDLYVSGGEDLLWPATEIVSLFAEEGGISSDGG
jgi:hypothetical protein